MAFEVRLDRYWTSNVCFGNSRSQSSVACSIWPLNEREEVHVVD